MIRKAEGTIRTFKKFKKAKQITSQGGLTHIITTDPIINEKTHIQDKDKMKQQLLQRNITHFAQAKNTPCMLEPLKSLIGEAGDTNTANDILQGILPTNVTPNMEAILQELKQKRPEMKPTIPYHQMIRGFQKWRESTTTSPSNKHLGIYRTLVQYQKPIPKLKTKAHQETSQE
jgi:hypothetical protein